MRLYKPTLKNNLFSAFSPSARMCRWSSSSSGSSTTWAASSSSSSSSSADFWSLLKFVSCKKKKKPFLFFFLVWSFCLELKLESAASLFKMFYSLSKPLFTSNLSPVLCFTFLFKRQNFPVLSHKFELFKHREPHSLLTASFQI